MLSKIRLPHQQLSRDPDRSEVARYIESLKKALVLRDEEIRKEVNRIAENSASKLQSWMML